MPVAGIGLALSALGLGASVLRAKETKKSARKQAAAQKEQAELQRRLEAARQRRTIRISKAQMLAGQAGQGVTSSLAEGAVTGAETTFKTSLEYGQESTALQREQFDIGAAMTAKQADIQIAGALGTFATTALTPEVGGDFSTTQLGKTFGGSNA